MQGAKAESTPVVKFTFRCKKCEQMNAKEIPLNLTFAWADKPMYDGDNEYYLMAEVTCVLCGERHEVEIGKIGG